MTNPKKGMYLGEKYFRNIITRRAKELGLAPDVADYLLQDFLSRDELVNDASINGELGGIMMHQANVHNIDILETDRKDLSEDYIADCCMNLFMRWEPMGVKAEEVYFWFDAAWDHVKARLQEQQRVKSIIKRSMKKKQLQ
jgi:hypothetical protein